MSTPCTNCNCPAGPRGNPGLDGAPGSSGVQGIQGIDGTNGSNGSNGIGIVSVVQDNANTIHFVRSDAVSTSTIILPAGPQGNVGATGSPGSNGSNGTTVTISSPLNTLTVDNTTPAAPKLDINFLDQDVAEGIQDAVGPFIGNTGLFTYSDAAGALQIPAGALPGQFAMVNPTSSGLIYAKPVDKSGFKNYITNGDFVFSQRGFGPFSVAANNIDRWQTSFSVSTVTTSLVAMTNTERLAFTGGARTQFRRTVFSSGSTASSFAALQQFIENPEALVGKQVTVSAWIKSNNNTPVVFGAYLYPGVGPIVTANTVIYSGTKFATSGVWTRYSQTFTVPSSATWGNDNQPYLAIRLGLDSGATYGGQFDNIGYQSGTVDDYGWQLEVGDTVTDLEYVPLSDVVSRCQRYLIVTGLAGLTGFAYTPTDGVIGTFTMPTSMRSNPTVTISGSPAVNVVGVNGNVPVSVTLHILSFDKITYNVVGSLATGAHLITIGGTVTMSAEM